ncbi:hypothetical protein GCM10010207_73650 [Streptomyces atratus]|nr:hypothetical protein GCM10010207_73650 [Streptomyces atratus]
MYERAAGRMPGASQPGPRAPAAALGRAPDPEPDPVRDGVGGDRRCGPFVRDARASRSFHSRTAKIGSQQPITAASAKGSGSGPWAARNGSRDRTGLPPPW